MIVAFSGTPRQFAGKITFCEEDKVLLNQEHVERLRDGGSERRIATICVLVVE